MRIRLHSSLFILLALFGHSVLFAQDWAGTFPQLGVSPSTAYRVSNVDRIDTQTGNLSLDIPLYSLPQKGKLKLSFSLVTNSVAWVMSYTCSDVTCSYTYNPSIPDGYPGQLSIQMDQDAPGEASSVILLPAGATCANCSEVFQTSPFVQDSRFGRHPLAQDANDLHRFRAIDGSKYMLYTADNPRPTDNSTVSYSVVDPSGITISSFGNRGSTPFGSVFTDVFGHKITRTYASLSATPAILKDSLDRSFEDPSTPLPINSSTAGCPAPTGANQPLVGSYDWTPPHSSGTGTYKICYVSVAINTHFFFDGAPGACDNPPENGICWYETGGSHNAISAIVLPDGNAWTFTYDSANRADSTSYAYGDLARVGYPTGGSVSYTYQTQFSCGGGQAPWTSRSRVIASRTENDANGHTSTWQYDIGLPAASSSEAPGMPLPSITSTIHSPLVPDPAAPSTSHINDTVYTYTDQGQVAGGRLSCNYALTQEDHYEGPFSGHKLLKSIATSYSHTLSPSADPNFQSYTAILPILRATTIPGAGTVFTRTAYNGTFQAIQAKYSYTGTNFSGITYQSTAPQTIPLGTPNDESITDYDGTTVLKSTHTDYVWELDNAYYQANLLSLPGSQVVSGPSNGLTTTYCYDNSSVRVGCNDPANTSPTGALGDLTKTTQAGISTSTSFNSDGMPTKTTDGNGFSTATVYDASTIFPSSVTHAYQTPIQEIDSYSFDSVTGNMTSHTDPNQIITNLTYDDPLNRVTLVQSATSRPEETRRQFQYPNSTTVVVKQDQTVKGDGVLTTTVNTDGLGRTVTQTDPAGSTVAAIYTPEGYVQSVSNPYIGPSATAYTSYLYDALGRKAMQCNQDNGSGSTCNVGSSYKQWSYSGNKVTSRDEQGSLWTQTYDSEARLTGVVEPGGTSTAYSYDVLGNLLTVDQTPSGGSSSHHREFHYDALGRLKSAFNPETGTVCYGSGSGCENGYDGNGNLQTKTDARGVTTSYVYDALNRLTQRSYSDGTPSECWSYDSAVNGVGRLAQQWTQPSSCSSNAGANALTSKTISQYDGVGRVKLEKQCVLAICTNDGALSFGYDLAGDLTTYNVPTARDLMTIGVGYNAAGWPNAFTSNVAGSQGSPANLLNISDFSPTGALSGGTVGTNLSVTKNYDSRLRSTSEVIRVQ